MELTEVNYIPKHLAQPRTAMDILHSLKDIAKDNGVYADFFDYDKEHPENPDSGTYFVVCADIETLIDLKQRREKLGEIIKFNKEIENNAVCPYYTTVKIPELYQSNYFFVHNKMCEAIQNVSIIRTAFYEFGYKLPKVVRLTALDGISTLYKNGHNSILPEHLQKLYRDAYKRYVSEMNQLYNKKHFKLLKTNRHKKHRVSSNYFVKNLIPVAYLVVPDTLIDYIDKHIDECPDFVYYKEPRPFLHTKDLSHKYKGPEQWNYWKDFTEQNDYIIGYPLSHYKFFNKMSIEHDCQSLENKVKQYELEAKTKFPLYSIRIRHQDINRFDDFCVANNVKYALNHDVYTPEELSFDPVIYYRKEDFEIIGNIVNSITREERCTVPTDCKQRAAADKNRPKQIENPFNMYGI